MWQEEKHPRDEDGKFTDKSVINHKLDTAIGIYSDNIVSDKKHEGIKSNDNDYGVKVFSSGSDANSFFAAEETKWTSKLTSEQKQTINEYTNNLYLKLNASLRGDKVIVDEELDRITGNIDTALENFMLNRDIKVYRGILQETYNKMFDDNDPQIGDVKVFPSYTSTTVDTDAVNAMDVLFEIKVSKGKGKGAYINSLSEYKDAEYEFLLPRDTMVKITKVRKNEQNQKVVEMEVIDQ